MSIEQYKDFIDLSPYPRPEPLKAGEKEEACDALLNYLMRERGMIAAFSSGYQKKRTVVRNAMNVRAPLPIPPDILSVQDRLFWTETLERGIVKAEELPYGKLGIAVWQGDICRLDADAIVNAANSSLLGCMIAGHNCIDNVIHSAAGMQLRGDCARIISAIGHEEECGDVKVTRAYNLPSRYVFHTVGPMVGREVTPSERSALRSCYTSCLDLAEELHLNTIAFCCISTGVFNFPNGEAGEIAAGVVVNWKLRHPKSKLKVIFDTYLERDYKIYKSILSMI